MGAGEEKAPQGVRLCTLPSSAESGSRVAPSPSRKRPDGKEQSLTPCVRVKVSSARGCWPACRRGTCHGAPARACIARRVHDVCGMESTPSKDPLHGVTLKQLLTELVAAHGWAGLADRVDIRCFRFDPSINSSLVFLRRTPWARKKVEDLYVEGKSRRALPDAH